MKPLRVTKSCTVPNESEQKFVWRKAAMVAAVVLDRGRAVGTWTRKAKRNVIDIHVQPMSGKSRHRAGVKREARAVARHLEIDDVKLTVGD